MREVINLDKLSDDGYRMPSNTLSAAGLDNITHAQLRYDTFLSPNIVQGVFVPTENSTVEFTVGDTLAGWYLKLYVSTDGGINYTERKSWGGTLGKRLISTGDVSFDVDDLEEGEVVTRVNGLLSGEQFPRFGVFQVGQTGQSYDLNGCSFIDANTGWSVGENGVILKTTNGAVSWTEQTSGVTGRLMAVQFVSSTVGWAVGESGKILKTTNGGTTWAAQTSGVTSILFALHMLDANTGWTVGSNITGGLILKTTNGGTTWSAQTSGLSATALLYSVFFASSTVGWVIGENEGYVKILKTVNGGTTWASQTHILTLSIYSIHAVSTTTAWIVGATGIMTKTTDGGTNWVNQSSGTTAALRGIRMFSSTVGWAVGYDGIIIKTTDGTTWTAQTSGVNFNFAGLSVIDANTVFVVGASFASLKTTNGGTTWVNTTAAIGKPIISVKSSNLPASLASPYSSYVGVGNYQIRFDGSLGAKGALVLPMPIVDPLSFDGSKRGEIQYDSTDITDNASALTFYTTGLDGLPANDILFNSLLIVMSLPGE